MKTLLLLEDEPSVIRLLRHMLKDYTLIQAASPEEALQVFIDVNHQVDLLVTDLVLPGMSGIEVAVHLRSKVPGLPVIVTSGFPVSGWSAHDSTDLGQLGSQAVAVLQKPFEKQKLLEAVCRLMESSEMGKTRTAGSHLLD